MAPGVEAQSLSHWSAREVPESRALKQLILCYVIFTSILKISLSEEQSTQANHEAGRGQIRPQAVSRPAPPSFLGLSLSHQLCSLTPSPCLPGSPRDARNLSSRLPRVLPAFEAWALPEVLTVVQGPGMEVLGAALGRSQPLKLQFRISKRSGCDVLGVSCQHHSGLGGVPMLSEPHPPFSLNKVSGALGLEVPSALQTRRCPRPSPRGRPPRDPSP